MRIGFIFIEVLVFWLIRYNSAREIKFTNFVCQSHNESWIVVHLCRIRAVNRHKYTVNFNATVLHPVNNVSVDLQVFKKGNKFMPWLFKFHIDCCQFLRKPNNPLANVYFKMFREFSNFNHTCPYVGPAIVSGFHTDYGKLQTPTPSGEYLVTADFYFGDKRQISLKIYSMIDDYEYLKPK